MVDNVRNFFSSGVYRRMASIATTSTCILCCVSLNGVCLADESPDFLDVFSEILVQDLI